MKAIRRIVWGMVIAALLLLAGFALYAIARNRPEDLPWTKLSLDQRPGIFTGRKLAGLTHDAPRCRALLDAAGVQYDVLPDVSAEDGKCGYADGVHFARGGSRRIDFLPANLGTSCPVAAALAMWEWNVVQPAAERHFGTRVSAIDHYGSYACRKIAGAGDTGWSEHATADAIDVYAFRLDDATRITVRGDWAGEGAKAAFLHEVRDGACGLFATTLSPDYNEAHADHLHLDQAARGEFGWRGCH